MCVCLCLTLSLFIHLSMHTWVALISYVNTEVYVSFQTRVFVFFRDIPRSRIDGSYGITLLVFWRTFLLFSIGTAPIYIPTNSILGFPSLHMLKNCIFKKYLGWFKYKRSKNHPLRNDDLKPRELLFLGFCFYFRKFNILLWKYLTYKVVG